MRVLKHLFPPSAKRLFPGESLKRITQAIAESELRHSGEICFAVEPALHPRAVLAGQQARDRAHEVFAQLRVWDTHANNGVLLYLLLADHRIEIVADRGLQDRVSDEQWQRVCRLVEEHLRAGEAEAGVPAPRSGMWGHFGPDFPRVHRRHHMNELPVPSYNH